MVFGQIITRLILRLLLLIQRINQKTNYRRYYNSYGTDTEVHFEIIMNEDLIWDMNKFNEKMGMTQLEKGV